MYITLDSTGNLYIVYHTGHKIRKLTYDATLGTYKLSTIAGINETGYGGKRSGTGDVAQFHYPLGITVDASGNLYVADRSNQAIRKLTYNTILGTYMVSTIAGIKPGEETGTGSGEGGSDDGAGIIAEFNDPSGITIDSTGNLYVADSQNKTIRKLVFVPDTPEPVAKDRIITGKLPPATNADGVPLTYEIVDQPDHGTVTITDDPSTGGYIYTYKPKDNFNGSDTFTYQDPNQGVTSEATITVNINALNNAPVADDSNIPTIAGAITSVTSSYAGILLASDADGDKLTYSIVKQPAHGTVTITDTAKGTYTYTSTDNSFVGSDSFQFIATDNAEATPDPATISITVSKPATSEWFGYYANQQAAAISKTLQTISEKGLLSQEAWQAASAVVSQGAEAVKAALTGTVNALTNAFTSFYNSLFG